MHQTDQYNNKHLKENMGLIISESKMIKRKTEELIKASIKANLLPGNNLDRLCRRGCLKKLVN